ncbi:DUF6686 family protein [Flavivirga eckloniae]|uniref:Uncharacterized protein n=1 Tax=Flavivirga eckloniae TaxID=1803846 RepID=A0A2K9PUA8_9FLAO|nr:DUF6686 family protein [Flavivirga eckloniae]AUP80629.1 hypothetical protein C1H87_18695 [Flavivirga eckloniae]
MCCQNTIAKNYSGQLSFCEDCQIYRLTFNNICIEFDEQEFSSFQMFLEAIDVDYWETKYERTAMGRKIPIQTIQHNLTIILNKQELEALKDLVMLKTKKPFNELSVIDIDYLFFLN